MEIKRWMRLGPPKVLAESHGRSLAIQKYRDQTGKEREYSHFRGNFSSSIVLALTTDNKVLVVQQYRPAAEEITLELPGGAQKYKQQTPESVALQEIFEETSGYVPGMIFLLSETGCLYEPSSLNINFFPYLFLDCRKSFDTVSLVDDGEFINLVQIPLEEWMEMCETGQIRDSKSLAVTYLAKRHIDRYLSLRRA